MVARPCLVCRQPTSSGPRCREHAIDFDAPRRRADNDPRYISLRKRIRDKWFIEHGPWCPGYRRPGHVSFDLQVDHIVPLARGGPLLDERNLQVLCRSCNGTKGDR